MSTHRTHKMIGANARSTPGGFLTRYHRAPATQTVVMAAARQWLAKRGMEGRASAFDRSQANTHNPR